MTNQNAAVYLPFREFILNENIPRDVKKDAYVFAKTIIENSGDDEFRNNSDLILIRDLDDLTQYMKQTDYINNKFSDIFIKYTSVSYLKSDSILKQFVELLFKTYKVADIPYETIYHKMENNIIFRSLFVNYSDELQLNPRTGCAYDMLYMWDINTSANFDKIKSIIVQLSNYYELPTDLFQLIKARLLDIIIRLNFNTKTRIAQESISNLYHILYENDEIIIAVRKDNNTYIFTVFYNLENIKNGISASRLCIINMKDTEYLSIKSFGAYPFISETSIIADGKYNKIINLSNKYIINVQ